MKKVALKRRVSLRAGFLRRLRQEGTRIAYKPNGRVKRRKPLKKVSRSKRRALSQYYALTEAFLKQPENKLCIICQIRREHGENILIGLATEVHHWGSRNGRLLCYVPWFRPSCRGCREWPHVHANRARELGLLAPVAVYGVYPERKELKQNISRL